VRRFLRAYLFEIIWLLVVAFGIFLLVERMQIRQTLARWLLAVLQVVVRGLSQLDNVLARFLATLTLSNAIGYVLILAALIAIVWRTRWRLMRTPSLTALRCPRCDGEIHRVHRHALDHLISWVVPVHRYRCSNRACRWSGLRVVGAVSRHGRSAPPPGR